MAEFQEVIRQWNRMCKSIGVRDRTKCLLVHAFDTPNCESCFDYALEEPAQTEEIVMAWAKDNPEPVYPTWMDWLTDVGAIPKAISWDEPLVEAVYDAIQEHVPADIAQKLGIEPKER